MILSLIPKSNLILRRKAIPVATVNDSIRKILKDMKETLEYHQGVGLAAPQVGIPLKIFVINVEGTWYSGVNLEIIKTKGEISGAEGCLSMIGFGTNVKRSESVTVKYRNAQGAKKRLSANGLLARVFQHEFDHLLGIMIVDKAEIVEDTAVGENFDKEKAFGEIRSSTS